MSYLNQRGVFLQMMRPSITDANTIVSLQLARKELGWDAEQQLASEALVDGDGDIDSDDKAKLIALAKAYVAIINP
jgi:hypothetical protein